MRTWLLLTFAAFIVASCNDDIEVSDGNISEFHFYQDATLTKDYPYVVEGDGLVFQRFYTRYNDPQIIGDEYSDQFLFHVVPENGRFLLDGEALRSM